MSEKYYIVKAIKEYSAINDVELKEDMIERVLNANKHLDPNIEEDFKEIIEEVFCTKIYENLIIDAGQDKIDIGVNNKGEIVLFDYDDKQSSLYYDNCLYRKI